MRRGGCINNSVISSGLFCIVESVTGSFKTDDISHPYIMMDKVLAGELLSYLIIYR